MFGIIKKSIITDMNAANIGCINAVTPDKADELLESTASVVILCSWLAASSTSHGEASDRDRCCGRLCDKSLVEQTHEDKRVLKLDKDGHPVRPKARLA